MAELLGSCREYHDRQQGLAAVLRIALLASLRGEQGAAELYVALIESSGSQGHGQSRGLFQAYLAEHLAGLTSPQRRFA